MITSVLTTTLLLASPALAAGVEGPPVCNGGGPYVAECQGLSTLIQLDGTGSFDPEGTPLTFKWKSECPLMTLDDEFSPTPILTVTHAVGVPVCIENCVDSIGLKVTSGGEFSQCQVDITVEDTLPPVITCPPDVTAVWGIDTTPAGTGTATAVDICNLNPVVTYTDTIVGGVICSGFEQFIHREWTAVDFCNNTSTCTQVISLLSPIGCSGNNTANLELDPSACVNEFDPTLTNGLFSATVMGTSTFDVSSIDTSSIQLIRTDAGKQVVQALRPWRSRGSDWLQAVSATPADCSPYGRDGANELMFNFRRNQVIKRLGLQQLPSGTQVPVAVTGLRKDGSAFWVSDMLVIQ